jgi:hypothetical protein
VVLGVTELWSATMVAGSQASVPPTHTQDYLEEIKIEKL